MTHNRILSVALAFAPFLVGCNDWKARWAYQRIEVTRTTQTQATAMFPGSARLTTVSLTYLQESKNPPMQDLALCLLNPQGLVTGKLAVRIREEHWGLVKKSVASMDGEVAPFPDANDPDSGPAHQLRLVYERLRRKQNDFHADQAHTLACAAILRILEALPGVSSSASDHQQLAASLAAIPPNGAVVIKSTDRQTYEFSYRAASSVRGKMIFGRE